MKNDRSRTSGVRFEMVQISVILGSIKMMYIFSMSLLIFSLHGFLIKTLESGCPKKSDHMKAFE